MATFVPASIVIAVLLVREALADTCAPGTFYWVRNGVPRCQQCLPGCACPGGYVPCHGCSGGSYSAARNAAVCTPCPSGTTSDYILNAGCDPESFTTPCNNAKGPLGVERCRPSPPPANVSFTAPDGALEIPPQYLTNEAPYIPNKVPPFYDEDLVPFLQQSY